MAEASSLATSTSEKHLQAQAFLWCIDFIQIQKVKCKFLFFLKKLQTSTVGGSAVCAKQQRILNTVLIRLHAKFMKGY